MKVENIQNHKGNDIKNQFIITTKKGRYFQSYNSIIVQPLGNIEISF